MLKITVAMAGVLMMGVGAWGQKPPLLVRSN